MESVSKINPEEVFSTEGTQNIDFEIAFTALLATILLSISPPTILKFSGYSLILLTLMRRMAITNQLTDLTQFLEGTRTLILAFSYVILTYLLNSVAAVIHGATNVAPQPALLIALVLLLFFSWAIVQEVIFCDLNIYLAVISNNAAYTAQNGFFSPLAPYLIDSTRRFATFSKADHLPDRIIELQRDEIETPRNRIHVIVFLITASCTFYGLFWLFLLTSSRSIFSVTILFASALLIQYPIDFLYSRYGAVGFYGSRSGSGMFFPLALGSLISILFV